METKLMEKLEKVFKDEAMAAKLKEAADIDAIKAVLAEAGVELTEEELAEVVRVAAESAGSGELSEDQMDEVSGGIVRTALKALGYTWKFACHVYGGPREAARGIYDYWAGKF